MLKELFNFPIENFKNLICVFPIFCAPPQTNNKILGHGALQTIIKAN